MDVFEPSLLEDPVPLLPLPNCVLFPNAVLPLHIFEPRYRTMTRELMERPTPKRLLALALLTGDYERLYHTSDAPIRPVVCVGAVIRSGASGLPDERSNIVVIGRARARISVEDRSGMYRTAMLKLVPTEPHDMLAAVAEAVDEVRSLLGELVQRGLGDREMIERLLNETPTAATMIDLGAFHLLGSQDVIIKQRILEEEKLEVRAEILALQLRRMLDASQQLGSRGGESWPPEPHTN